MNTVLKIVAFFTLAMTPIYNELMALLFFMLTDIITGIWKSIIHKNFSSRGLAQSVGKFTLYFLAITVSQLCDLYFPFPKVQNVVTAGIVLIEITSIMENITAITGVDLFGKVVQLMKRSKP